MDPNEAYQQVKAAMFMMDGAQSNNEYMDAATLLFNHVAALDEWLSGGGFLPDAWQEGRTP